jgi:broad specificity phosphatase PhoE
VKLIIVRHAESVNNSKKCFEGSGNQGGSSLTVKGGNQARMLASYLSGLFSVDCIYSSPTVRTLETSAILKKKLNSSIVIARELMEIDCGKWGNKPVDLVKEANANEWKLRKEHPTEFCFPQGESLLGVENRIIPFMERLLQASQQKSIVLVSHSAAITIILAYLLKWPLKEAWLDSRSYHANTAFTILKFETEATNIV